jgi:hypothetical protein
MVRDSMPLAEDRDAIIEVLQFTDKVFDRLINRLSPPDLQLFQDAWNETRPVLQEQISLLQAISSETNSVWTVIQRLGLTGKSLAMKLHYLAKAAIGGWPKKLLDLLNKFLGSLVAGLPGTEQIKELKEWLEEQIGDDSTPDQELVSLYNDQGYKHFRATP